MCAILCLRYPPSRGGEEEGDSRTYSSREGFLSALNAALRWQAACCRCKSVKISLPAVPLLSPFRCYLSGKPRRAPPSGGAGEAEECAELIASLWQAPSLILVVPLEVKKQCCFQICLSLVIPAELANSGRSVSSEMLARGGDFSTATDHRVELCIELYVCNFTCCQRSLGSAAALSPASFPAP